MATQKRNQVNIDFTSYPELLKSLGQMAEDDDMKVGPFLRKLVKQEKVRRQQAQLPLPLPEQPKGRKSDTRAAQAVAA